MKIVAIAHRSEKHKPVEFTPHLEAEAARSIKLYAEGRVRELYNRSDGKGAVLVLEAENEQEAERLLDSLPLAKLGMLTFDIYPVKPYRGFIASVS